MSSVFSSVQGTTSNRFHQSISNTTGFRATCRKAMSSPSFVTPCLTRRWPASVRVNGRVQIVVRALHYESAKYRAYNSQTANDVTDHVHPEVNRSLITIHHAILGRHYTGDQTDDTLAENEKANTRKDEFRFWIPCGRQIPPRRVHACSIEHEHHDRRDHIASNSACRRHLFSLLLCSNLFLSVKQRTAHILDYGLNRQTFY